MKKIKYSLRIKTMAAISAAAVGITAVFGGTWAYMTNTQNATNTFTAGKVAIKLTEPDWPGNDTPETTEIVSNQEISKNPQITNTGTTKAVVFAEVEIPIDEYNIATADGETTGVSAQELFWFKASDTGVGQFKDTIHGGEGEWNWLQNLCYYKDADGNFIDHAVSGGVAVHVFGYQTAIEPGETTVPIFDKVQLKNIVLGNDESLPAGSDLAINVRAFAIQGSWVLGNTTSGGGDLTYDLSTENLTAIFERYCNQNNYELGTGDVHKNGSSDAEEKGYKITLSGDGITSKTVYTDKEGLVSNLSTPSRNGYTFAGWFTTGGQQIKDGDTISEDTKLIAKWNLINYAITYDLDGGTADSLIKSYNVESGNLTLSAPSKEGHVFKGWIVNGNSATVVADYTIAKGSTGDIALKAVWETEEPEVKQVTVTFNINNSDIGLQNKIVTVNVGDTVSYTPDENVYGEKYTFAGWYTRADGGEKLDTICPAENTVVYAHWTKIKETYTLTFDPKYPSVSGDSYKTVKYVEEGNQVGANLPTINDDNGYRWLGWNTKEDGTGKAVTKETVPTNSVTYYGTWELINYKITYDLDDGVNADGNPYKYNVTSDTIAIAAPSKDGYTFEGWQVNGSSQTIDSYTISKGSIGDITLKAVWTKIPDPEVYTVTFHMGYTDETATATRTEGTAFGSVVTPSWDGHTFDGWYTDVDGGDKITADTIVNADMDVYAHWTALTYDIAYNYNGGIAVTTNPATYTADTRSTTKIAYPRKNGYKLVKVIITGNSTGKTYTQSGSSDLSGGWRTGLGEAFTEDVTVSFVWEAVPYTVSFHTSSGTFTDGTQDNVLTVENGKLVSGVYAEPTRDGYTFSYWFTTKDGAQTQVAVNADGVPTTGVTENMTLSAYWTGNVDTVTYDGNGGTFADSKTNKVSYIAWNIANSSKYTEPTREGYEFTGWYTDAACTNAVEMNADGNGPKVFGRTGSDYTYYAGWKAKTYTITYDLAGGSLADGNSNPATYTPDDTVTIANPSKEDYVFLGWSEDGGVTYTHDLTLEQGTTGNKTLTAVYEKDNSTVKIAYDLAGGKMPEGSTLPAKVLRTEDAFTLDTPTQEGYIFDGWLKTGNADPVKSLTIDPATESSNITVTAVWHKQQDFTITYMPENGADSASRTAKEGEVLGSIATATWTGYTFDGWYTEKDGGERVTEETVVWSDMTLYGHWTANTYNITYNYNDGSLAEGKSNPDKFTAGITTTINYPIRSGYKLVKVTYASASDSFVKTGDDMSGYVSTGLGKVFDGDVTVTFEWEQVPFKITYHTTSGVFTGDAKENVIEVQNGSVISGKYEIPTRNGYTFSKWFVSGDSTQSKIEIDENGIPTAGVTADMDLYAYWMADVYTITYNLDGGSFQTSYKTSYTIATADFTIPQPVKAGYSFAGWTGSNGVDAQTEVTVTKGTTGNLTYTANWISNYTVTFHSDNGSDDFVSTVRSGDTLNTLPSAPARDGYTFVGWFTDKDLTTQLTVPYAVTGNMDVYAKWEKDKAVYTIALSLNEGEMADGSVSAVTDDSGTLTALADPTRSGYTFNGWYTDVNLTNKAVFPITFAQDATLFAEWTKDEIITPVTLTGEHALGVQVKFSGAAAAQDMTYKIEAADDTTSAAISDGKISLTSAELGFEADTAEGTISKDFGDISFTEVGTYTFNVALSNISAPEGWNYDLDKKTITVKVAKEDGKLTVNISGNDPLFTNVYTEPAPVSVTLTGDTALTADVSVSGKDAEEIFAFKLEGADEITRNAITSGTVILSSDIATAGYKLESDEVKTVTFGDIIISETGTYKFKVSETNASPSDEMWTYANTEADAQTIIVNVEKSGSKYTVSIANNGPSFVNMYGKNISTPVKLTGDDAIKVYAAASGADSNDTFTFTLTPSDQITKDAVAAGVIILEKTEASTSGTISAGSRQEVSFGTATFERTGTYTFKIKETNTSVPDGWTYANTDEKAVTLTVTITKDLTTGKISYQFSYTNTVFTNSYSQAVANYVTPQMFGAVANDDGDDTSAFNRALSAVASSSQYEKVYVPSGTYEINATSGNGIQLLSNTILEMADDAVLNVIANDQEGYDCIIAKSVSDAQVIGGKIVGDRDTHNGTEGEWGHGIGIYDSQNVSVTGTTISSCWGDGVYIGTQDQRSLTAKSTGITLTTVTTDNNRRNGLSIVAGDNITVSSCLFANTNGHDPQYGIDIETNHWKDGDKSSTNQNITIINTTCAGNKKGSIGFVAWCDYVTLTNCTMNGPIYNQMGQHITLDNTVVYGSAGNTLNRGLIMANGSYFDGGYSTNADTCIASVDMSTEIAKALVGYNYAGQNIGTAILDDADSSSGKALYILRQTEGTENAGAGYALSMISNDLVEALVKDKQYRVEITAKAVGNTSSWIFSQVSNESSGGFAYPWTINVSALENIGTSNGYAGKWDFCPETYYTTFSHTFTANGSENALWVYDLSQAASSGLYVDNIKLYEVN